MKMSTALNGRVVEIIYPGSIHIEGTIQRDGHFEKGRWVDQFTPFFEDLFRTAKLEDYIEKFEVSMTMREYIFKNGAAIGLNEKTISLGIFTKDEIRERRYCNPCERTMPECGACKGPVF